MRITYRNKHVDQYWNDRWENVSIDAIPTNTSVYPLRYSELAIQGDKKGKILEAGCGAGRVLRYYHERGFDIEGFDYVINVVKRLNLEQPALKVRTADIKNLPYSDCSFDYILAFGLFHNLENGLLDAFKETARVLKPGGVLCASFRAHNIQNYLNDGIKDFVNGFNKKNKQFHKANITASEYKEILQKAGYQIRAIHPVVNMPLLYKIPFFRQFNHKMFNENLGRKEGYLLSPVGNLIQDFLVKNFPYQFCNVFVAIAEKPL